MIGGEEVRKDRSKRRILVLDQRTKFVNASMHMYDTIRSQIRFIHVHDSYAVYESFYSHIQPIHTYDSLTPVRLFHMYDHSHAGFINVYNL